MDDPVDDAEAHDVRSGVDTGDVEAVKQVILDWRAREVGGCFNPSGFTYGECADGDCYCARKCVRVAKRAIATLQSRGWKKGG